jgi:CheY-like chemotaxis protein
MARILVVDDEPAMRRLLREYLSEAGHSVVEACEAAEAISILLRRDFDLVVTDVQMPYLDGLNLAGAIRADPKTSHIPIVVLTGNVAESVAHRTDDIGAYLVDKSSSMDEVVRHIARALARATGMPAPKID